MGVVSDAAAKYMAETPRAQQDAVPKIRTFTGLLVNPLDMQATDFDIRDIAHHLSHICRYTGAVPQFYSVAQHSVLVGRYFLTTWERLAGLLHDASEAYLNDMASPVKRSPDFAFFNKLDDAVVARVYGAFGLGVELFPKVKPYDDLLFRREVASFWPREGVVVPRDQFIKPLPPRHAKKLFLDFFRELVPGWSGATDGRDEALQAMRTAA